MTTDARLMENMALSAQAVLVDPGNKAARRALAFCCRTWRQRQQLRAAAAKGDADRAADPRFRKDIDG